MNIARTPKSPLVAAALLAAATVAKADTTYIWNRQSDGSWNKAANWQMSDGSTATAYPNSADAVVVLQEEKNGKGGFNIQGVTATLKEMRIEGAGGIVTTPKNTSTDNLVNQDLTYEGTLIFAAGGGISFPDMPAVSTQPLYYYLPTVPACQGNGEIVFNLPGNVEMFFNKPDILQPSASSTAGEKPVLVKRGKGTLRMGNGGASSRGGGTGSGKPEVALKIEDGTARLVYATTSHNIAVPLTIAGDEVTIVIDAMNNNRVESAGGLGFGTGYLVETAAVTGGKHSIVSQYGSVLGFYGATAASQTFSGCLAGNLVFEFMPTSSACEFVFSKGVSTTTGAMTIATGTVRVTDGASFPNVGTVSVNGGTVMIEEDGAAAFPSASFTISNGGRIGASAGLSVCVKAVSGIANGIYKRVGSSLSEGTEASWVAGDGLVVVGSPVEAAHEEVTWVGKGANYYPSTSANWSSAPQSLTDGSAFVKVDSGATASSGYASFVADSDVWVNGFSVSKMNFGIGAVANRELWIGSGGITNPANGEVVVGFGSAPGTVVLSADQTWNSGNSGSLRVHGNVKTYGGAKLTVRGSDSGNNVLRLASATPDWKNAVLATNMVVKFEAANALGSSKVAPVTIFHNHIHDIGKGVLSDMGAIYTLGVSPGTRIAGNLVHGIDARVYGGLGIYSDEGSSGIKTVACDWNLYFNPNLRRGDVRFGPGLTWAQWRARGQDVHSLWADPKFADPAAGDFAPAPDSPAFRLGFRPIDLSSVGPRPAAADWRLRPHEDIEWTTAYAYGLADGSAHLPRVLLVGDSICRAYAEEVRKRLEGRMNVSYWSSSYCVTSAPYLEMLATCLDEADYDVIHFNNGLHSFNTPLEDYGKAYRAALDLIRRRQPEAALVRCACTPVADGARTAQIRAINAAGAKVAAAAGIRLHDDLFALSETFDRETAYVDGVHFSPAAVSRQAAQVAACVLSAASQTKTPNDRH